MWAKATIYGAFFQTPRPANVVRLGPIMYGGSTFLRLLRDEEREKRKPPALTLGVGNTVTTVGCRTQVLSVPLPYFLC